MPSFAPHIFQDDVELKVCSKCKAYKTLDNFCKSKQNKDCLHVRCNDCRRASKKIEYQNNQEKYIKRSKDYYKTNKDEVVLKNLEYRKTNRAKINQHRKEYRENNLERVKEIDKLSRDRNKEKIKLKDAIRAKEPKRKAQHTERNKKYRQTEKGKIMTQLTHNRRRSRKVNVSSTLTKIQWKYCKDFFHNTCAYCGKYLKNLTQDHFIPLASGGGYDANNIIPACKSCNSSKQNRDFFLWYSKYPLYDESRKQRIITYLELFS